MCMLSRLHGLATGPARHHDLGQGGQERDTRCLQVAVHQMCMKNAHFYALLLA